MHVWLKTVAILVLANFFSMSSIIIIIIIKKGLQCKAEREWCTPYQSEDPSHTCNKNL